MNVRISPFLPCRVPRRLLASLSPALLTLAVPRGAVRAHRTTAPPHLPDHLVRPRHARPRHRRSRRPDRGPGLSAPRPAPKRRYHQAPAPLLKDRKDVQLVGIVSGDDARSGRDPVGKEPVDRFGGSGRQLRRLRQLWRPRMAHRRHCQSQGRPGRPPARVARDLQQRCPRLSGFRRRQVRPGGARQATGRSPGRRRFRGSKSRPPCRGRPAPRGKGHEGSRPRRGRQGVELKPTGPGLLLSLIRTDLITGDAKGAEALPGQGSGRGPVARRDQRAQGLVRRSRANAGPTPGRCSSTPSSSTPTPPRRLPPGPRLRARCRPRQGRRLLSQSLRTLDRGQTMAP